MSRLVFLFSCLACSSNARTSQRTKNHQRGNLDEKVFNEAKQSQTHWQFGVDNPLRDLAVLLAGHPEPFNVAAGWQFSHAGDLHSLALNMRSCSPVLMKQVDSSPELLDISGLVRYRAPLERQAVERMLQAYRKLQGSGNCFKSDLRQDLGVKSLSEAVAADAIFDALVCGKGGQLLNLEDLQTSLSRYAGDDLSTLESDIVQARANFALTWLGFNAFQTAAYYIVFAAQVLRNMGVPMFGVPLPDGVPLAENAEALRAVGLAISIAIALSTTLTLQMNQKIDDNF